MWYPDKNFGRQERWLNVLLSLPRAVTSAHSAGCLHVVCREPSRLRQKKIRKSEIERDDSCHNIHTMFILAFQDAVSWVSEWDCWNAETNYRTRSGKSVVIRLYVLVPLLYAFLTKVAYKINPKILTPSYWKVFMKCNIDTIRSKRD
jgi:hypothetical protein